MSSSLILAPSLLFDGLHLGENDRDLAADVAVLLEGAGEAGHLCTLEPLDLVLELHVDVAHLPLLLLHPDQ